jgi:hypothetical protein
MYLILTYRSIIEVVLSERGTACKVRPPLRFIKKGDNKDNDTDIETAVVFVTIVKDTKNECGSYS